MGYSGAGGKPIHEKNRSKKSRDTVPLRVIYDFVKKIFAYIEHFFSFRVVIGLRGIIVAPPIMVQSKKFYTKTLLFMHN
jgi:hypothetical protein